jgi:hypothetical protein
MLSLDLNFRLLIVNFGGLLVKADFRFALDFSRLRGKSLLLDVCGVVCVKVTWQVAA